MAASTRSWEEALYPGRKDSTPSQMALLTPAFLTPGLQNCERIQFRCFKPSSVRYFFYSNPGVIREHRDWRRGEAEGLPSLGLEPHSEMQECRARGAGSSPCPQPMKARAQCQSQGHQGNQDDWIKREQEAGKGLESRIQGPRRKDSDFQTLSLPPPGPASRARLHSH